MTHEELAAEIAALDEQGKRDVNEILWANPDAEFILEGKPGTRTGDPDD